MQWPEEVRLEGCGGGGGETSGGGGSEACVGVGRRELECVRVEGVEEEEEDMLGEDVEM